MQQLAIEDTMTQHLSGAAAPSASTAEAGDAEPAVRRHP
jgi:hypothetical protein